MHAKGSGAFGVFETTEDVSAYTKAALFQPGVTTEMLARFSTVAGEQGSPDTWRDPRGFALKFYTDRGQLRPRRQQHPGVLHPRHDEVPALHPQPEAPRRLRPARQPHAVGLLDLNPESAHQVTYLMGDRGIPKTWRHMNGYGSHTYMWINAAGEKYWVKYHFHSDQGVEGLTDAEATRIAGEDADFHRRDLLRRDRRRRLPALDAVDPGDALRGREDLPLQPVRPDQGLAAQRLPADQGRHDDPEPQPGELLRPDRAGGLRAAATRAGHRLLARTRCCSAGRSPTPTRTATGSAPTTCSCRSTSPRVEVNTYTSSTAAMAYDHSGDEPVYAPNSRRPRLRRRRPARSRTAGRPTARWCAGLHAARRRRRLRPGRHAGPRGLGRRAARGLRRDRRRHLLGGVKSRCSSGPSSTGRTSTPTPASRSRSWSAPAARRHPPRAWARLSVTRMSTRLDAGFDRLPRGPARTATRGR